MTATDARPLAPPQPRPSYFSSIAAAAGSVRPALLAFAGVAAVIFIWQQISVRVFLFAPVPQHGFPDYRFFEGWTRWDSDWYLHIAQLGYFYDGPGKQSAVAYFPGYPAAMRAVSWVVRDALVAGVVVTYTAGLAAAGLFWRWCRDALGVPAARLALALLLVHPFAYFLMGAVYSDALFLAAALAAFVALEHDHPWLAGLAGAVATATRPVGVALALALVLRTLERRGFRGLRVRDAGVLLSVGGLAAYLAYQWWRFDDPLAFTRVYTAVGWSHQVDLETILKYRFFWLLRHGGLWDAPNMVLALQGVLTVTMLALVPVVVRRLGWAYGLYALIVIMMPAAGSDEFLGMGRYTLAAFPCFAAGGALLAARPRLAAVWLTLSVVLLGVMSSSFARWYFYS
ncbi:MAG: mannosyltransferase family protein [Acidimicrobiia bacterium]